MEIPGSINYTIRDPNFELVASWLYRYSATVLGYRLYDVRFALYPIYSRVLFDFKATVELCLSVLPAPYP